MLSFLRKPLSLILLLSLLAMTSACKKDDNFSESENILLEALSGEISTLDPASSYDTISASIVYQVYEPLYEYHYLKRPYTLQPLLAEDMPKVEDNGKKYTIKIKKDIAYHPDPVFGNQTRTVKAQDFITQIKRLAFLPTKSNGWWLFDGRIKGINEWRQQVGSDFEKFKSTDIPGLSAPDDHTLVIELTEPYPQMLYSLAMSFTAPMPLEAVERYENIFADRMIGTGPFKLTSYTPLSEVKLEKFEGYHEALYPDQGDRLANSLGLLADAGKKLPFLDGVHFKIIRESQTRWLNFRSKKLDLLVIPKDNFSTAIDPSGNLSDELKKDNIKLQIFPTLTYWWNSFNMQDPVVGGDNINLRKAVAHAIDIDKFIQLLTNNTGQKANSIYPPGISGYDPSKSLPYEYNIEKAREYLKLAGYPEGKGLPEITYDVRGTSATNRQQGEFIKGELAKVGINIKVITNTFPAFLKKSRQGQLQMWLDGWALDYPDAENILQLLVTKNHAPGPNATYYSNKKFDEYFDQLKLMNDGPEKKELMVKMENLVNEDLPWVMHYYARSYIVFHNRLKNYRHSDLIYNNMKYLRKSGE